MLARIITENKNYDGLVTIVENHFASATFIAANGLWQGQREHTLIIEIDISTAVQRTEIESLVYAIKKANKQDKVLVQYMPTESHFI